MWVCESVPYLSPRGDGQADAWSEEAQRAGRSGGQRLREAGVTTAPPDVAEALRLPDQSTAVVRRRTILLDGKPVELADSWYPLSLAGGTPLAVPAKIKGGAVTLLARLGYTAHESLEEIAFRAASIRESEILEVQVGALVIDMTRTVFNNDGIPFEVSKMTMLAEGRLLRYRLAVG